MEVAPIAECPEGPVVHVTNSHGKGLPGVRMQPWKASVQWSIGLDSRGRGSCFSIVPGETVLFDAPGYGRHRDTFPARTAAELTLPWNVTLTVSPELVADAARVFAPSIPDAVLRPSEVAIGIATTMGDFTIAVDTARASAATPDVRRLVDSGLQEDGSFRVLTGLEVVRELQRRPLNGQKLTPTVTIIAIKWAR
jgi:hypothetical protein